MICRGVWPDRRILAPLDSKRTDYAAVVLAFSSLRSGLAQTLAT